MAPRSEADAAAAATALAEHRALMLGLLWAQGTLTALGMLFDVAPAVRLMWAIVVVQLVLELIGAAHAPTRKQLIARGRPLPARVVHGWRIGLTIVLVAAGWWLTALAVAATAILHGAIYDVAPPEEEPRATR